MVYRRMGYVPRYMRGRYRRTGYYGRYKKRYRAGQVIVERKFLDNYEATLSVSSAGTVVGAGYLTIPLQSGESARNGRKIVVTKVQQRIRLRWQLDADDYSLNENAIRIMLAVDKQCNGVAASVASVIETANDPLFGFNNLSNKGRFVTLYDKWISFNRSYIATTGATEVAKQRILKFNKKCRVPILYDGTTGAIGDRCCNNLFLLMVTDHSDSGNHIDAAVHTRVRFMDV